MSKLPNEITREVEDIMGQCAKISIQMDAVSDLPFAAHLISEWRDFIDDLGNARYCTLQDLLDTDKALRERISELEDEVSDKNDKIESLEDDHNDALQELRDQITNMEVEYEERIDERESEIELLRHELSQSQDEVNARDTEIQTLTERVAELEDMVDHLN